MSSIQQLRGLSLALLVATTAFLGSTDASARRGPPRIDRSPEAAEALAQLVQSALPALEARQATARARADALDQWFAGELDTTEAALPELVGLPMLDPAVAWGHLRKLDVRAESRAAERVQPLPPDLHPLDAQRYSDALNATLDAEDAADSKVRRFWLGLIAAAEKAPGLRADAVAAQRAILQARAPTPETIGPEGPPEEVANAAVDRAQAEAALHTLQMAAIRAATIPGDRTLRGRVQEDIVKVQAYLALPGDRTAEPPPAVADAADRLLRVGKLAPVSVDAVTEQWKERSLERDILLLARDIQALNDKVTGDSADAPVLTVEVANQQLELTQRAHSEAQAEWTALNTRLNADQVPSPGIPVLDALRLQRAASKVELATLRTQLAEQAVDRARQRADTRATVQDTTDDDVAQAKADAAAREAEAERAAEQESTDAALRQQVAEFSKKRAEILEDRKLREESARTILDGHIHRLQEQRTALAAALSLGPLDKDRQNRLDDVYRASRTIVTDTRNAIQDLRSRRDQLGDRVDRALEELPNERAYEESGADTALVSSWRDEIAKVREALERDRDIADRDLDSAMDVLADAKAFRRLARTNASSEARAVVQTKFVEEIFHEFREIPFIVVTLARQAIAVVRQLPSLVLDLGAVATFLRGSFELVILTLIWWMARDRTGDWLTSALGALKSVRPGDLGVAARINDWVGSRGVSGNWLNLDAYIQPVLLRIIDLIAGYAVYSQLPLDWTLIRVAMFFWLARTAWLAGTYLVPVLLVIPGEDRPAASRVSAFGRNRALRTVQVVLLWSLLSALFQRIALDILDADRLFDLVGWMSTVSGWALAIVVLHVWSPDLRDAVAKDPDDNLGRTLTSQSDSFLLRAPIAALAVVVLALRWVSDLATSLVEQRSNLGWVRTAMARQSLKNSEDAPTQRLPTEVLAPIRTFEPSDIATDREADLLTAAYAAWLDERRRGMVAVTGQRGSGKSRLLARVPDIVGTDDQCLPIHRVRLDRDIFDPDDALRWLVAALADDDSPSADPDTAIRLLKALPPTVFVVDDLHRCFLRAVGGFRGLRQVLTTMHAVSDRHFWICAFHGDNWAYLEGVGGAVNLGVFRTRVAMQPLTPTQMRDWLEAHTRDTGITPTYDDLAAEGWMGSDPERARERARNAYFRLLAEATRGNPRVALETWTRSLRRGDDEGTAAVVLFDQPDGELLSQGGDHALFVLAALVQHDGLDVRDLMRVLNLNDATCRSTCRRLESLGVLESDESNEHYDITMAWGPAVHRHLRRKHLLHRE